MTTIRRNDPRAGNKNRQRINDAITAREVRLIDAEGENVGVVSLDEAKRSAAESGLDLVEISPEAKPPVCKVMDFGKHLFEQKKAKAAAKKKQKVTHVKEIKFRPGTDIGDYQVKLRNLIRFLEDGDKAKITVRFRGREMAHQELGMELLQRIEKDLEDYGTVESRPSMEGRQMTMMIGPKKKK
ncbi:MAG: translation initiation factor IF-3 [Kangiellaceae bacterium]|nr:translation initiation factor IF-3 [Kangiellaceae bacterium]